MPERNPGDGPPNRHDPPTCQWINLVRTETYPPMSGVRPRSVALVALVVSVALLVGPAVASAASPGAQDLDEPTTEAAGGCFSGDGTSFVIGSEDDTHIWVRLHLGLFTGSGGSVGVELTGSTDRYRVVETVAGVDYAGEGVLGAVTSPLESFQAVGGFELQLPMLETATQHGLQNDTAPTVDESNDPLVEGPFDVIEC